LSRYIVIIFLFIELMLRTSGFIPFAAPSTAAFAENSPKGRFMDEARCQRDRSPFWQPSANTRKGHKSEEHRMQAATGGLLTRAIQALALRVLRIQICSRQICLWLLSFRLHGCRR
jgi:hypothetical protein